MAGQSQPFHSANRKVNSRPFERQPSDWRLLPRRFELESAPITAPLRTLMTPCCSNRRRGCRSRIRLAVRAATLAPHVRERNQGRQAHREDHPLTRESQSRAGDCCAGPNAGAKPNDPRLRPQAYAAFPDEAQQQEPAGNNANKAADAYQADQGQRVMPLVSNGF